MAQRIFTLSSYLFKSLLFSFTGIIYILLSLAFWFMFFDPRKLTPEPEYYVLVIGLFGAAASFLITLSVAARAHRASNYPLIARLPSRIEHLTATLLGSLGFSILMQSMVATLATINGPNVPLGHALEIPPIWVSANLLSAVLALHASDLVTAGWSRVYVYGLLAIFLFGRQIDTTTGDWLSRRIMGLGNWLFRQGWANAGNLINEIAMWLNDSGMLMLGELFDLVFWPFNAITSAIVSGSFHPIQALAPALLILYAAVLFILAADFFATKDLYLPE